MAHYLDEDQLEAAWEQQGMKHRFGRLHDYMVQQGLGPMAVRKDLFVDHVKDVLHKFLVQGLMEDKDGRQRFPGDPDTYGTGEDA